MLLTWRPVPSAEFHEVMPSVLPKIEIPKQGLSIAKKQAWEKVLALPYPSPGTLGLSFPISGLTGACG